MRSGIFDRLRVSARVLPERQRLRIAQIAGLTPIGQFPIGYSLQRLVPKAGRDDIWSSAIKPGRCSRGLQFRAATRTARRRNRNGGQAIGTVFGRCGFALSRVHGPYDEEDNERDY